MIHVFLGYCLDVPVVLQVRASYCLESLVASEQATVDIRSNDRVVESDRRG